MSDTTEYVCSFCGESFETPGGKGSHVKWNHQEKFETGDILEEIRRLAERKNRAPKAKEMDAEGSYSSNTVIDRFGSWVDGVREAGLEPLRYHDISKTELRDAIKDLASELGGAPTALEMDDKGRYTSSPAKKRFGDWNSALRSAGFEPNHEKRISEDRLLGEIQRLADDLGRPPTLSELGERGEFSSRAYYKRFGSWVGAVREAGYQPIMRVSGRDHHNWVEHRSNLWYGPNWNQQRRRALERDAFECQSSGCRMTQERHREQTGLGLNVHHLIPLSTFEKEDGSLDYERANSLDNLVTLCISHHIVWEQMSPLRPDMRHREA